MATRLGCHRKKTVSGTVFEECGEERDGAGALDADRDEFACKTCGAFEDDEAVARRPAAPLNQA